MVFYDGKQFPEEYHGDIFAAEHGSWNKATPAGYEVVRVPLTKDLFGIEVPPIVTVVDRSVRQWIEGSHMVLAYLLAAVVLVHIVGALRHHILKHNDVLRRMTWGMRA